MRTNTEALAARLDVLSMAIQEIARALAPSQAVQVADGVERRATAFASLTAAADEAASAELAPLLAVLRAAGR